MKKFMVQVYLPDYLNEDFYSVIPKHRAYINNLIENGSITNYCINAERTRGWIEMNAKSVEDVKHIINRFPIKKFIRYDINEIMIFDGEAYRLPKLILN